MYEKRHIYVKRDLYLWKEAHIYNHYRADLRFLVGRSEDASNALFSSVIFCKRAL